MKKSKDIDGYIRRYPKEVQIILERLRTTITRAAPKAEEIISYGMPAFKQNGILVYFAAWKNHIGFYAMPSGNKAFKKELSPYQGAKGSVRFPIDEPLPFGLIRKIVAFRLKENLKKDRK